VSLRCSRAIRTPSRSRPRPRPGEGGEALDLDGENARPQEDDQGRQDVARPVEERVDGGLGLVFGLRDVIRNRAWRVVFIIE